MLVVVGLLQLEADMVVSGLKKRAECSPDDGRISTWIPCCSCFSETKQRQKTDEFLIQFCSQTRSICDPIMEKFMLIGSVIRF